MSAYASSGYTSRILGPESFESIFDRGAIMVYSGARPTTPNAAAPGTLLGRITLDGFEWTPTDTGFGLRYSRTGPYINARAGDPWVLYGLADGVAGWARMVAPDEPGGASFTAPRLDFEVNATGAAGLALPELEIRQGISRSIDAFFFSLYPVA